MLLEFRIEIKSYILLIDVQMLFDLHEDYALRMLAIYFDEQQGFVEEDSSDDKRLETNINAMECLKHCFEEARKYKESGLPSKYTFKSLQEKMQLHKCSHSARMWMKKQAVGESQSIDLFRPDIYMADEDSEVHLSRSLSLFYTHRRKFMTSFPLSCGVVLDVKDDFLACSKWVYFGKDATLLHYLCKLLKGKILVYYSNFSQEGIVENLVLKTLSKFISCMIVP
ncbi:hypothetical protein L7F22_051870 [Adiantum nelumboides]|nr:hypothetical protein [Adiantum nelumboides]